MARTRSFGLLALLSMASGIAALGACGPAPSHLSSLVNAGGDYNGGGRAGLGATAGLADAGAGARAGEAPSSAGRGGDGGDGAAAGDQPVSAPLTPFAVYPGELQADVGCGTMVTDAVLVIRNDGSGPLSIDSASADFGYDVKTKLPLSIAPAAGAQLLVTPPAAQAGAMVGAVSSGTLSFTTNEPGTPTHTVELDTQLFGASLEFLNHSGSAVGAALTLTYLDGGDCPDTVKYRVHNTGNVAFVLFGPDFPVNFTGTTTGASGQSIAPDGYVELMVGGNSAPGDACAASGQLTFTTKGAFCGSAPALNVVWPASAGQTCACAAAP